MTKSRIPHVFTLLTGLVFLCSLLTFLVPSGEYEREDRVVEGRERTVLVPGTFTTLPKDYSLGGLLFDQESPGRASPESLEGALSAIPRGMVEAAGHSRQLAVALVVCAVCAAFFAMVKPF